MNYILNHQGFENNLVYSRKRTLTDGVQYVFKFENGHGASVIKGEYSYGGTKDLWELAVIHFYDGDHFELTYDTEITDDVIGYQTNEEILDILERIKRLPPDD